MYQNDLISDVGMFHGDDAAYYLHREYRVVSIEAHPTWAEHGGGGSPMRSGTAASRS
jgi:hypothetical protein